MAEDSARLGYNTENNNTICVASFNSDYGASAYGSLEYENEHIKSVIREIQSARDAEKFLDMTFNNPTKDNPVRVQDVLRHLDLSEIAPALEELYKVKRHFRFPPEAVLRTMIFWKLKGYKYLSQVFNDLLTNPTLADSLGFGMIPDYKQLYHFLNYRLNREGISKLFDAFLKAILKKADEKGIPIGYEVMTDSTPLQAKKKDPDATYSGHYKVTGYKLHSVRCALTGIPLEYHVTPITEYDGHILLPQMLRMKMNDIYPRKIYMDTHYASLENIARLKLFWNDIEIKCNIPKDWKVHREANEQNIFKWYNELWDTPLFISKADFEYQQLLLLMTNDGEYTAKHEKVGHYYRNQIIKEFYANPEAYLDDYHRRNRIEGRHGTEKLLTNIANVNGHGIEKFATHVGLHVVSIMALALARLQNGVTEGLVDLGGLI